MKRFSKILLVILCAVMVSLPLVVRADEETSSSTDVDERSKIPVYMFRGEGCAFCAKALTFFEEIQEEYGKYYELKTFEVWNDATNKSLMDQVAEYLDIQINGVPFIIIGEKTFSGFPEETKAEIKKEILAEYNRSDEDRTDIVKAVQNGEARKANKVGEVVTVLVIVGLVVLIVCAKKSVNAKKPNAHVRTVNKKYEENEDEMKEYDSEEEEEEEHPVKAKKEEHVIKEKKTSNKKKDDKSVKNNKEESTSKKGNNKTSKTTKKNNRK